MGFLSKIYERRGKTQRQADIRGFVKGAGDVSGKDTGATHGGSLSDAPGSSPAARDLRARDASGPASAVPVDSQSKPRSTSRSRARFKPDPFDFETSRDAAVEEPPVSPATRSPPSGKPKPKPAARGGSPSPVATQNKPSSSRSPGTASASPSGSAGTFGAARDAVPFPRETPRLPEGVAADPFLPTPGKRRRVTFAEVDAFTLDEEEDEDNLDVPARGRRDCDPFDFPEDGDVPRAETRTTPSARDGEAPETTETTEAAAATTTATAAASPGPRPAWGFFGGSPATSPEAERATPRGGKSASGHRVAASGLAAPSPEWAKRAPTPSRSPSASPMDADAQKTLSGARRAPEQKPLTHPSYSPSAAMAMVSPSPPPRGGGAPQDPLPESGDALAALDEAQYALSGLGADQPEAGRLACASSLVAIAANARFRRALAQHGLAPRLCRAALDLCESIVGVREGRRARDASAGVIARALAAERRRATSPALGLSAAALLYLSTLELRAGEAAAVYAERDVAGILAGLMRAADFHAEEGAGGAGTKPRNRERPARRLLLDETNETNETSRGFGALLADGAEAKALRTTRDALGSLKFLPHESVDAPTLALLAAHRALAQTERAAARASQREARRRIEAEKRRDDDHSDVEANDPSLRAEAEGDEAAILGWSGFKASLAAGGAVLETARLADEAAREIFEAGARCFSRRASAEGSEDGEARDGDPGADEDDASAASQATDAARASRAMARLFRCMRVVEAATFGSPPCADACVSGSLGPARECAPDDRPLLGDAREARRRIPLRLVPMRVNDAVASPAPRAKTRGDAETTRGAAEAEARDERALADVVRDTRVDGIELSPRASPDRDAREGGADGDGGGSAGAKRRAAEEEDEAATAKRFRTAEALLLTPSPGSKRSAGARAGAVAGAIEAAGDVDDSVPERSGGGGGRASPTGDEPARRRGARGGAKMSRAAEKRETKTAKAREPLSPAADAETPTFNFSRVAAAVDASIAWLDDDEAGVGANTGRTLVHALLGAIPTLAAAAATAAHATAAGGVVCGVRTARAGGLGADPRLAAGTLRAAVCVLTNLTNENPAGCAAVRAHPGGLETAAALVPWCAALEGLLPGAGPDASARAAAAARAGARVESTYASRRRGGGGRDTGSAAGGESGEGHDMLNAALCFLVNVAETDADARRVLRALEADAGAMEAAVPSFPSNPESARADARGTRASRAKKKKAAATAAALASRRVGLVELLARIFVRAGGAGPTDADGNLVVSRDDDAKDDASRDESSNGEVTAEMLERESSARSSRDEEGDGLITQAYAALLVAFLVEGQPALRADVKCALPENGFAALAGVLERFRAFHEQLESISEESRESLTRVIRWLRGT